MTDVRLTATTPEGDVVPVLSNTKGELLLEEPIAPPGFDGNLDGDLFVNGIATFTDGSDYNVRIRPFNGDGANQFEVKKATDVRAYITGAGDAAFAGTTTIGVATAWNDPVNRSSCYLSPGGAIELYNKNEPSESSNLLTGYARGAKTFEVNTNGGADFSGDVVIGSRGSRWLIRESNGVAMLIEQGVRGTKPRRDLETVKVRDLPRELDLIEAALNEVMEKLRMTPPAGWEVWDGSDNSR